MGSDRRTLFLNRWNQSHEVSNLFVLDGASFPSLSCQNPTLTIMALVVRACDYIVAELKRHQL